jgi:hypothetical protein
MGTINKKGGSQLDKYIKYNPDTDRLEATKETVFDPSTIWLGGMSLSNGVNTLDLNLPDGTETLVMAYAFDSSTGTKGNPHVFMLDGEQEISIGALAHEPLENGVVTYTTTLNSVITGIKVAPLETGKLNVNAYLGTDNTNAKISVATYDIKSEDIVSGVATLPLPNALTLHAGMTMYVEFSGITLAGTAATNVPTTKAIYLPATHIDLIQGVLTVNSDITLKVGVDYMVDTTSGDILLTVPDGFTDSFTVYDSHDQFSASNRARINFNSNSQGVANLVNKGDIFKFYYDGSEWRYINILNGTGDKV